MAREWRWTAGATVLPGSGVPVPVKPRDAVAAYVSTDARPDAPAPPSAAAPPPADAPPPPDEPAVRALPPASRPVLTPSRELEPFDAVPPTPRVRVPAARPGTELARWISYLDAVEHAALDVAESVASGHSPSWPDLSLPGPNLPASLVARRDEVLALVEDVTVRAERRRDVIAGELAALAPSRREDGPAAASLGNRLDVVG